MKTATLPLLLVLSCKNQNVDDVLKASTCDNFASLQNVIYDIPVQNTNQDLIDVSHNQRNYTSDLALIADCNPVPIYIRIKKNVNPSRHDEFIHLDSVSPLTKVVYALNAESNEIIDCLDMKVLLEGLYSEALDQEAGYDIWGNIGFRWLSINDFTESMAQENAHISHALKDSIGYIRVLRYKGDNILCGKKESSDNYIIMYQFVSRNVCDFRP